LSVIAKINDPKFESPHENNVLGAFIGNNCVGNISSVSFDERNDLYFITIFGSNENPVAFKYFDSENQLTYSAINNLQFESNKLVGSIDEPYMIDLIEIPTEENPYQVQVLPNPFVNEFDIEFNLSQTSSVYVSIFDVTGREISKIKSKTYSPGINVIQIQLDYIESGIYFIELDIDGTVIKRKIVKS